MSLVSRQYKKLAIAAFVAVVSLSCHRESLVEPAPGAMLMFSAQTVDDAVTRTHWDGTGIQWSGGDRIAVTYADASAWADEFSISQPLEQDARQAVFSARTSLTASSNGNYAFYGIYPSVAVSTDFSDAPCTSVTIPQEQTPSSSSFDSTADILYGYSVSTYKTVPSEPVSMFWRRLVAHADITLTLPEISPAETVEKIEISADENALMTGQFMLDMQTGKMVHLPSEVSANKVAVLADNLDFSSDEVHVWLSVAPCLLSSLTVVISTDIATYTREISSCNVEFAVNKRNLLAVDMTGAVRESRSDPDRDALINPRLFSLLDLDMPEMEKVKYYYDAGLKYEAAEALVEYYRQRNHIQHWNHHPDPTDLTITSTMQLRADKSLKENGYRFYVSDDYLESTDPVEYYSFDQNNDGIIEWDFSPVEVTSFRNLMHRHPWVGSLAQVYYKTKDEKYAKSLVEVYLDWLKNHPCPGAESGNYVMGMSHPSYRIWCNLASSTRSTAYVTLISYIKHSVHFTPEFLSELLVSLYDCAESIRHNYYYAEASNIRLSEVQAVLYLAVLLPEFRKAQEWLDETVAATDRLLGLMMMEDGCLVEKDMHYHIGVLSTFYNIHAQLDVVGKSSVLPEDYFSKLKNSIYIVRDIMYPDYSLEALNETQPDRWTKSDLLKNFKKYVQMLPDDQTLLWTSTQGKQGNAPEELLSIYPYSGFYMFRTGWTKDDMMLILSNNENYYGYAHNQPDNGTVSLYNKGRRFLPDAGSYTYGGNAELDAQRAEFRATKNHNTLTLNETDAKNNIEGKAGLFVKSVSNDDYDMVHVSNQSYETLKHERWVYHLKDGFFVIVDVADGTATGSIELNWHLAPGSNPSYLRSGAAYECRTGYPDGNNMAFRTFCFDGTSQEVDFLAKNATSWSSSAINVKEERPCHQVSVQKSDGNPIRFVTVIYPFSDSLPDIEAMFNSSSRVVVLIDDNDYVLNL